MLAGGKSGRNTLVNVRTPICDFLTTGSRWVKLSGEEKVPRKEKTLVGRLKG